MACTITKNRPLPCRDSVGGVKNIYFGDFTDLGTLTFTDGVVTAWTGTDPTWTKWEVKSTSSLEQAINASRENGTRFYEQTITAVFPKLDVDTQDELDNIVKAKPLVAIEDNNGNFLLCGFKFGCDVNGGSISTGTALGDLSGFNLTLVGQEPLPAYFITSTLITGNLSVTDIDA